VTGQKSFIDFVLLHPQFCNADGSILPASQVMLLEWFAWFGAIKLIQLKTINFYISHVLSTHINVALPFTPCKSPLLQRLIVKNGLSDPTKEQQGQD